MIKGMRVLMIFCLLLSLLACNGGGGSVVSLPVDTDGDGIADAQDNCRLIANANQADQNGNGIGDACETGGQPDQDGDGIADATDNCPLVANANQADQNGNGIGDVCETGGQPDQDGDGVPTATDNCPATLNANQADGDADGVGNACDNCPAIANANQADANGNGVGDACEPLPAPANDTFAWTGNTLLTIPAATGLLSNDPAGSTVAAPGARTTTAGGTVTVNADGSFTYDPQVGDQNIADTFTYAITGGGTATVTINLTERVWYVNNSSTVVPADGSNDAPFITLAAATALSDVNDTIFVFSGNGTNQGQNARITLQPGQKLIGQGVALVVSNVTVVPAIPATPPVISDTVNIVDNLPIVGLASGVEVAGVIIDGTGGVANMQGMSGDGINGFNIHNNTIRNVRRAAIQFTGASGGTGIISTNTITNVNGPNPDNAVNIVTTAAGATFTITANSLSNILETGIRVQFTGAGGGTVAVTTNTLTNIGTNAGRRGIDVDAAGTAAVTSTISSNTVDNTGVAQIARAGIQVNATGTALHSARVTDNTIRNANPAPADGGIQVQNGLATSSLCLQMTGNSSDSGILLDNRPPAVAGTFRAEATNSNQASFELANTLTAGVFAYLPNVGAVTFVPPGTCGFAP